MELASIGAHRPLLVDLLTDKATAVEMEVCTASLARWRRKGTGPRFVKIGRKIFYRRDSIKSWLAAQEIGSTAEQRTRARAAKT